MPTSKIGGLKIEVIVTGVACGYFVVESVSVEIEKTGIAAWFWLPKLSSINVN